MAGSTTNIGLIKPTYSEDADVAIINENMDTLDSTISALDNGLAIVSNNNTHGAITAGQYVYVRNHGSLAEGMYTANSNIAANATLSSSNLTAVSSGSLNKLNSDISALNGKISTVVSSHGLTAKTNVTLNGAGLVACGLLRFYHFYFTPTADIQAGTELIEGFTAPYLALSGGASGLAIEGTSRQSCTIYLSNTGVLLCSSNLQNGKSYRCSLCYVSNTAV